MLKVAAISLTLLIFGAASAEAIDPHVEQKSLQDSWYSCLQDYGHKVARGTNEQAETIVRAAMTACENEADALYMHYRSQPAPLAEFLTTELYPAQADHMKEKLLSEILLQRSSN